MGYTQVKVAEYLDYIEQQINLHNQRTGTHYIWRSTPDSKTRSHHASRDGQIYSWDNPPSGGHPQEDYNCRCRAIPIDGPRDAVQGLASNIKPRKKLNQTPLSKFLGTEWPKTIGCELHYIFGAGRAVTLREAGDLERVIAQAAQENFFDEETGRWTSLYERVEYEIEQEVLIHGPGRFTDYFDNTYFFGTVDPWLANGRVLTEIDITVEQQNNLLIWHGEITYNFSDEITDPLNIREQFLGGSQNWFDLGELIDPINEFVNNYEPQSAAEAQNLIELRLYALGFERREDLLNSASELFVHTPYKVEDIWTTRVSGIIDPNNYDRERPEGRRNGLLAEEYLFWKGLPESLLSNRESALYVKYHSAIYAALGIGGNIKNAKNRLGAASNCSPFDILHDMLVLMNSANVQ